MRAIIAMAEADNIHLNIIAEGVETLDQKDTLIEYWCASMQGYLF